MLVPAEVPGDGKEEARKKKKREYRRTERMKEKAERNEGRENKYGRIREGMFHEVILGLLWNSLYSSQRSGSSPAEASWEVAVAGVNSYLSPPDSFAALPQQRFTIRYNRHMETTEHLLDEEGSEDTRRGKVNVFSRRWDF